MATPEKQASCEQVANRLTDYLEQALGTRDQRRIEAHLSDCPSCQKLLAELRLTITLLARLSTHKPQK